MNKSILSSLILSTILVTQHLAAAGLMTPTSTNPSPSSVSAPASSGTQSSSDNPVTGPTNDSSLMSPMKAPSPTENSPIYSPSQSQLDTMLPE